MNIQSSGNDILVLLKPVFIARILSFVPPPIRTDVRRKYVAAPAARLLELAAVTNQWAETLRHFSAIIWHSWLVDDGSPHLYFVQSKSLQPKKAHFIAVFFRACERSVTWLIRMLFVACLERYENPSLLLDAVDPIRSTTALHLACLRDQPDVVSLLLEYTKDVVKVLNSGDATGNIPLSIAVTNGSINVIKYFARHTRQVASAVDFVKVSFLGGNNILHLACKSHKVEVLQSLLEFPNLDTELLLMQGKTIPIFVAAENVDHADDMLSVIFPEIADMVLEEKKYDKSVCDPEISFDVRIRLLAALGRPHRCAAKNILRRLCEASKLERCSKSIRFFAALFPHLIFATPDQEFAVVSQLDPISPAAGADAADTSAFSTLSMRTCFTVEEAKQKVDLVKFFLECASAETLSNDPSNDPSSFSLIMENELIQKIRNMWENKSAKWWTNLLDPQIITGIVKSALMPVHASCSLQTSTTTTTTTTTTTVADYEVEVLKLLFRYFSKGCCSNRQDEELTNDSASAFVSARNDRFIKIDRLLSRSCYSEHHLIDYVTSSSLQNDAYRLNTYTETKKNQLVPTISSSNNNEIFVSAHRRAHITGNYDLTRNPIIADICRSVALNSNVHQAKIALQIIKFLTTEALTSDEFLGICDHGKEEGEGATHQKRFAKYLVTVPNAENMMPLFILADCVDRTNNNNNDSRQEKNEGGKTEEQESSLNSIVRSLAKCLIDAGSPFDVPTPFPAPIVDHNHVRSAGWGESPEIFRKRLEEATKLMPKRINDPYAGMFPIHRAARNGNASLVKLFCKEYQDKANHADSSWPFETPVWNLKTENLLAKTPLHFAVENFHEDVVDVLLYFGADATIADDNGLLPDFDFMRATKVELEKERQRMMAAKEAEVRKTALQVAAFNARKTRGMREKYGSGDLKPNILTAPAYDGDATTTTTTSEEKVVDSETATSSTRQSLWNYPANANTNTTATVTSNAWNVPAAPTSTSTSTTTTTNQSGWSASGWSSSSAFTQNFTATVPPAPQYRNMWGGYFQHASSTDHNVSNAPTWRSGATANTFGSNDNNNDDALGE